MLGAEISALLLPRLVQSPDTSSRIREVLRAARIVSAYDMSVSNVLFRATNAFLGLATLGSGAFLVSLMYNAATTYQAQVSRFPAEKATQYVFKV